MLLILHVETISDLIWVCALGLASVLHFSLALHLLEDASFLKNVTGCFMHSPKPLASACY